MKSLPTPPQADLCIARSICAVKGWVIQQPAWLASYANYIAQLGCAKTVFPAQISPNIADELYELYGTTIGRSISEKIRTDGTVGSCPICGSEHTGTVDHFLPRETFPEYSIFGPNLVPACAACNLFAKQSAFVGPGDHDYLIHPYFDEVARQPLWTVRFTRPLPAVTFEATPLTSLKTDLQSRVRFHLRTVLKKVFTATMEHRWPAHIRGVADRALKLRKTSVTSKFVRAQTKVLLEYASACGNHNSWLAAFYRGVLDDGEAVDFIRDEACKLL